MEVYEVQFWEFWSHEEHGTIESLKLCAEDAEEAIKKARSIAFEKDRAEYTEEPNESNELKKPTIRKLKEIEIRQVIHKESLDG